MKKIKFIALLLMAVLSVNMMSAATKTIYCKMEQSWWKVDGAAVGCHSWGTGTGTTWPGVRMTPVQGETDLWSIDLDTDQVQNVIFTRVSPEGISLADWGAKTKDLTIPTNGDNLFTITTSDESWGDPGCDGEWSVYGTSPVVTEPAVTDITITGDKYVGTELTFAATVAGFSAEPMVVYEVKAAEGEYAQAQGGKFTPTAAGNYTVKATAFYQPEEGDAEEAFKEVDFTVTEAPVKEYYLVGWINGANSGCDDDYEALHAEYKFVDGQLKVTFTETSYVFVKTSDNSHWFLPESYVAPAAKVEATLAEGKAEKVGVNGNVEVTFTITENQDGTLTLAYEEATSPVETKYYAKNNWNGAAVDDWSWLEMSATDQENVYMLDSVVFGGTGVNINTKEDDTDALWFAADAITVLDGLVGLPGPIPPVKRDTILDAPRRMGEVLEAPKLQAGDTINLFFNAADSTLSAAIVGRPAQPEPVVTFDLTIEQDTIWTTSGGKVAAWIWGQDGLNGEWTDWAIDNEGTLTLKVDERADSIIFKRFAPEVEVPYWDGTAEYQWNEIAKSEIADCHLFIITDWNEGAWCERPEKPTGLEFLPYEENSKSLIQNSKLIKDGRLFIIREGKMYNAHGAIIK